MRIIGTIAALFLVAACSSKTPTAPADPVALVSLAQATHGSVADSVTLYGAAENGSAGRGDLSAPIEAILVSIAAPVGTRVARGQVVARLAVTPTARLEMERAAADARLAAQTLARAQRLRADGLVSNAEVDAARAAVRSTAATQSSLTVRSGQLTLTARSSGYVEAIVPAVGAVVPAGGVVATVVQAGDLRARFGIDPALARRLGRGASLRVIPTGGGSAFSAPILSVDPVVDPVTRLASVYTLIPYQAGIGAGETLSATIQVTEGAMALTIPYAALLDDGGQPFVYVVARGIARRRDVRTGAASGERIAIISGLAAGDLVVVTGGTALDDGMKVRTR